jgi:UDP-N-acetylmuramate--alanine ligase
MYHFIGIKGTGMSALATILKQLGNEVKGSDIDKHFFTESGLIKNNINFTNYNASNIDKDDIIIRGASIKDDNPEVIRAKELNLDMYMYNEMVGKLTKEFKTICIAGCHGKTTTTAMMAHVLGDVLGLNYLIGDGTGYANRNNKYFALESCEYKRHFLAYTPYYAVITNIDLDHVDYYKDIFDVVDAYTSYANNAINKVVAYGDDAYTRTMKLTKEVVYYGISTNNDIYAANIEYKKDGISFDVFAEEKLYGHFDLPIYGEHQLLDSLAVITIGYLEQIKSNIINDNFQSFTGAKRRFSETVIGNNIVIDDYAHHPNEVKCTIEAIRQKYPNKKIVGIFQPHTFSRTKEFASNLVKIFNQIDYTYILDIHPAREKQEDYPNITSDIIINELVNGEHINIDEALKLVRHKDAIFIFMSPNDISKLEDDLKELLKK